MREYTHEKEIIAVPTIAVTKIGEITASQVRGKTVSLCEGCKEIEASNMREFLEKLIPQSRMLEGGPSKEELANKANKTRKENVQTILVMKMNCKPFTLRRSNAMTPAMKRRTW